MLILAGILGCARKWTWSMCAVWCPPLLPNSCSAFAGLHYDRHGSLQPRSPMLTGDGELCPSNLCMQPSERSSTAACASALQSDGLAGSSGQPWRAFSEGGACRRPCEWFHSLQSALPTTMKKAGGTRKVNRLPACHVGHSFCGIRHGRKRKKAKSKPTTFGFVFFRYQYQCAVTLCLLLA